MLIFVSAFMSVCSNFLVLVFLAPFLWLVVFCVVVNCYFMFCCFRRFVHWLRVLCFVPVLSGLFV